MRRARAKQGDDGALLFETLEERVLLNAAPFAPVAQSQPIALQNGTQLFATLTGPGHIQVTQTQSGEQLTVTGTNATSSLVLTVKGGSAHFDLSAIDISGPMNSITGSGVDLHGQFIANGPLHFVSLGNVQNSTFTASGPIDSLNLGKVQDSTISVNGGIGDFELNSWISTGAQNKLTAASIGILHSAVDFDASMALSGPSGSHGAPTLGLANIGGTLADGYWYVVGDASMVMAGQVAANWTGDFTKSASLSVGRDFDGILATPDLKFFSVGGNLNHAQLMVGADLGPGGHLGDGTNHYGTGTLEYLSVRGSFIASRIWDGVVPGPTGTYDAGGDTFFGQQANDKVQFFMVGGSLDATSKVEAGAFTAPVFANSKMFVATTDPHFITHTVNLNPLTLSLALSGGIGGVTNNPAATASFQDVGPETLALALIGSAAVGPGNGIVATARAAFCDRGRGRQHIDR